MATSESGSTMADDLRSVDKKIIDVLREGRNVPSNIADEIGMTRQYIQSRLEVLEAKGIIQNIGRGVYELIDDPREQ